MTKYFCYCFLVLLLFCFSGKAYCWSLNDIQNTVQQAASSVTKNAPAGASNNNTAQPAAQQQAAPVTTPVTQDQAVQNGQSTTQVTTQQIGEWASQGLANKEIISRIKASDSVYSLNDLTALWGKVSNGVIRAMEGKSATQITTQQIGEWASQGLTDKEIISRITASDSVYSVNDLTALEGKVSNAVIGAMERQEDLIQGKIQKVEDAKADQQQAAQEQAEQQKAAQQQAAEQAAQQQAAEKQQQADQQQAAAQQAAEQKRPPFKCKFGDYNWGDGVMGIKTKLMFQGKQIKESDEVGGVKGKFLTYQDTLFETPCAITLGFSAKSEKLSYVEVHLLPQAVETIAASLTKKYGEPLQKGDGVMIWGGVKKDEDTLSLSPDMSRGGSEFLLEYLSGEFTPLLKNESDEKNNAVVNQDAGKL